MALDLPCIVLDSKFPVYHIGTLDFTQKGINGFPTEGNGVTISRSVETWAKMRQLYGLPVWQFEPQDAQQNLSLLLATDLTPETKEAILAWAYANELVEPILGYRVLWDSPAFCVPRTKVFYSGCKARAHAKGFKNASISEVLSYTPTAKLRDLVGTPAYEAQCEDAVLVAYVSLETSFCGIWWDDVYDPECGTCPRGVLVPHAVESLKQSKFSLEQVITAQTTRKVI